MKQEKDSNSFLAESGQTAMEAFLLISFVGIVGLILVDLWGPLIEERIVSPIHAATADVERFGNHDDGTPINEDNPQVDPLNPFNSGRVEAIHYGN